MMPSDLIRIHNTGTRYWPVHVDGVLHGGGAEEVGRRTAQQAVRQVFLPLRTVRQAGRLERTATTGTINYRDSVAVDTLFLLIKISLPKRVKDAKDQIQWEEGLSRRVAPQDNQHK